MSNQLRHKGRFIKKKVLDKKFSCVRDMAQGKKRRCSELIDENVDVSNIKRICPGRRIVELDILAENLKCINCKEAIFLKDITNEKRFGLQSVLTIVCQKCSIYTAVPTGKIYKTHESITHSDVNTKAILGAVHSGMGNSSLNKLLACLNIPTISPDLYKRYEREIGPALEKVAKDSCKEAAAEERQLVIDNIDTLCEELPPEIVEEIYPLRNILKTTPKEFDSALGNIVNIIISYDMGWSKRGNGRSYNSLNGYGCIIGFLSGKILDFGTRNRKCKLCENGRKKEDHDCRQNFDGSAKAMESDLGVELVNNSSILKENGVDVRVVIGDEDSSTIANIRKGNEKKVFKLADQNHLRKNFGKDLYGLQPKHKEMKKKGVIAHIKKCFSYAVDQNKGDSGKLSTAILEIPEHFYGNHVNCGTWCSRKSPNATKSQTILLHDLELKRELETLCKKYADNAEKFSIAASSQANESVNNIMAHKAPKNRCYSLSQSADYRFASSVCSKNKGEIHLLDVHKTLNLSPGQHTKSFAERKDKARLERRRKQKLPTTKAKRNKVAKEKENLRKQNENNEGIQYKSNCGFDIPNISNNNTVLKSLSSLKGIVSGTIIKKMVNAGIDFEMLLTTYKNSRNVGLVQLLTAPNSEKKARVTKHKKIIDKITTFFKNYCQ